MSPQHFAAQHMAAQGRGPDSQLVHMSPREVAGLQALAMAGGGSLSINPETGLPEAGFLDKMLPMLLGVGATALTGGAAAPWMIGLGLGGIEAARTGSLEKGLMAGLGAYGGAGLAGGLMAAGGAGAAGAGASTGAGMAGSVGPQTAAIDALGAPMTQAATSATPSIGAGTLGTGTYDTVGNVLNAGIQNSAVGGVAPVTSPLTPFPHAAMPSAATAPTSSFSSNLSQMGRGLTNLTEPAGREAFMGQAASKSAEATGIGGGKGLLKYGAAAGLPLLMDDTKRKMPEEDKERFNYAFDAGRTEEGYVDPVTGQRRYFNPTYRRLFAAGGPVEEMSAANVYDMQNARGGVSDMGIDNSTGMQRMAGGGITGSGELNLNIPLDFGGGAIGGFGQGPKGAGLNINQGPLDLGQRNTGFGQAGVNGYTAAGSGTGSGTSITGQPLNRSMAAPFGINTQPQNPFNPVADETRQRMMQMARERGNVDLRPRAADLERNTARKLSFDEFKRMSAPRHPGDRVPTEAGYQDMYAKYLQDQTNQRAELGGLRQEIAAQDEQNTILNRLREMQAAGAGAPLAHVLQPGTSAYENAMMNRGAGIGSSFADGGITALAYGGQSHLGDYSDGGRLLRGPGDGVSDSIPAMIGQRRPARLADGEFVVPARIVSELGNGSTDAGARKLYAMMDRVQRARGGTTGKGKVAKNSRADKFLPA